MKMRLDQPYLHDTRHKLASYLPWLLMYDDGVVLQKRGVLQRTYTYRGRDFSELEASRRGVVMANFDAAIGRLGEGWAHTFELQRVPARLESAYPSAFRATVPYLIDAERTSYYEEAHPLLESRFYHTVTYKPEAQAQAGLSEILFRGGEDISLGETLTRAKDLALARLGFARKKGFTPPTPKILSDFEAELSGFAQKLSSALPGYRPLTTSETLTFLRSTISTSSHRLSANRVLWRLDEVLPDMPVEIGTSMRIGSHYVCVLGIKAYPNHTSTAMLGALSSLSFPLRYVARFISMGRREADRLLATLSGRAGQDAHRVGSTRINQDALLKEASIESVRTGVRMGEYVTGYFTGAVVLTDRDPGRLEVKAKQVRSVLDNAGFEPLVEKEGLRSAWFGSLPGQMTANPRRPVLTSTNFAHLAPTHSAYQGERATKKPAWPALVLGRTYGASPFWLTLHENELGHTLFLGKSRSGKSTGLLTLALGFLRVPGARIVMYDYGKSSRAATYACGGHFYDMADSKVAFQPLRHIHDLRERTRIREWLMSVLETEGRVRLTDDQIAELKGALEAIAGYADVSLRTIGALRNVLMDPSLKRWITPLCHDGEHGHLFDGDDEQLALSDWTTFEMKGLEGALKGYVSTYLFLRLDDMFTDERPTLLLLDEAWTVLEDSRFIKRFNEWLRTLAKLNVAVVFASQQPGDVFKSPLIDVILDQCQTRLLTPNAGAGDEAVRPYYERLGLGDAEIEQLIERGSVGRSGAKKEFFYYYVHPEKGGAMFTFDLQPGSLALSIAGAGSAGYQAPITRALASRDTHLAAHEEDRGDPGLVFCVYFLLELSMTRESQQLQRLLPSHAAAPTHGGS